MGGIQGKNSCPPPFPILLPQDPPFGIHLCGPASEGYVVLEPPVVPVHDERVRPYRAIPIFHPGTVVQHYLRPEEMRPFYVQARAAAAAAALAAHVGEEVPGGVGTRLGTSTLDGGLGGALQPAGPDAVAEAGVAGATSGPAGIAEPPACADQPAGGGAPITQASPGQGGAPEQLYSMLVEMGLLRR